MIKRVLLAYDGSEASLKAFESAHDLASRYNADLRVLAVAPAPEVADEVETPAVIEDSRRLYQQLLDRLRHNAQKLGIQVHAELVVGHPAQQILDRARDMGADLIVIGHRGHGAVDLWKIGSVAHRVISYAECAVLVVR